MLKFLSTVILSLLVSGVFGQVVNFDNHLQRGESLYGSSQYREAHMELTKARKDALDDKQTLQNIDFLLAMCQFHLNAGEVALRKYINDYPASEYDNEVRFALATEFFEKENYNEALKNYAHIDKEELSKNDYDEYIFKIGCSFYHTEDYDTSCNYLDQIDKANRFYPHAQYLLGFIDYSAEDYDGAKLHFTRVIEYPPYNKLAPFYMLHIEFRLSNFEYVVDNCKAVLSNLNIERQQEILRMTAESWFMLEGWKKSEEYILRYKELGGKLGRVENYILGYSIYRMNDYKRAIEYLRLACGPNDKLTQNAAYHLGGCYLRLGDNESAMQSFSMAYSGGDDAVIREDALYNYCKLMCERGGHFNEEVTILGKYMTDYPSSQKTGEIVSYFVTACYNTRDFGAAYEILYPFRKIDKQIRKALQSVAFYQAMESYTKGHYKTALIYLNKSLEFKEYNSDIRAKAFFWKGNIAYINKDYKEAVSQLNYYLKLGRKSQLEYPFAFYDLGYIYFNDSQVDLARKNFNDFLWVYKKKDGYYADVLNRLGDMESNSRNFDQAISYYSKAAAFKSEHSHYAKYNQALAYGMANKNNQRIATLRQIIAENKGHWVVASHFELGRSLVAIKEYTEAAKTFEHFISKYPSSQEYIKALSELGLIYQNLNNTNKSLKYYKMVVEKSKHSQEAKNAMNEIMNIYTDRNDVDSYFNYAKKMGIIIDSSAVKRDSLTFAAAQKLYISGNKVKANDAFDNYLKNNANGSNVAAALYYGSDCALEIGDKESASKKLTQLTEMYYNNFTQRGFERLAVLGLELRDYKSSAAAYLKLSTMASTKKKRSEALLNHLEAVIASEDNEYLLSLVDGILASPQTTDLITRKATFAKAKALSATENHNDAIVIYNDLSKDVSTLEGAESAYIVIETTYNVGNKDKVKELVFEFADKNTPHSYWLAKAFLRLGDIYVSEGDIFQARATYQSIIDGYSATDDDIIYEVKERIKNLK